MKNQSDWLNRADYTAEERRNICAQIMSEAQYWDSTQYQRMMHDSTKRLRVDLTDAQIEQVYFEVVTKHRGAPMPWGQVQFGRALLEKFKEVNT